MDRLDADGTRVSGKDLTLLRVIKGELKADDGDGQLVFDSRSGRLIRGEKHLRIRGNLTVEAAGKQSDLNFVSDNRLHWRVLDSLPK